ncbi:hypothetical protein SDC9_171218 [bioreactor metagenome]|uniref:Uncharacterized protein n=1 Tax=bioreactor metagenome TaxID=1076179 RepID=A0A645GB15_9ZZZZ
MAFGQIVVNGNLMACVKQFLGAYRTYVARSAGNKNVHKARNLIGQASRLNGKNMLTIQ